MITLNFIDMIFGGAQQSLSKLGFVFACTKIEV